MSNVDLQIAKLLKQDWTYRHIRSVLHVGSDRIRNVKKMMEKGVIKLDGAGNPVIAKPAAKEVEEIHAQVMEVVTRKASEMAVRNVEEDYALGNEIRQYWSLRAKELGMTLRDYVRSALIFYDTYREKVEEMEGQRGLMELLKDALKQDLLRSQKMDLFYKFTRYCISLRAQGFQVPESLLNDFYSDLSTLETFLKRGRKSLGELMGGMGNVGEENEGD